MGGHCRLWTPEAWLVETESAFQSWISSLIETTGADVIAIDGKTARRSFKTKDKKSALHTEISSGHGRIETRTCQQLLIDKSWLAKAYDDQV